MLTSCPTMNVGCPGLIVSARYKKAGFAWPVDPQGFTRLKRGSSYGHEIWDLRAAVPTRGSGTASRSCRQRGCANLRPRRPTRRSPIWQLGPGSAWNSTNYGYLWWVEPTTGVAAYYALGFGGQLVEVVPTLHLVIVVPTYVDDACPDAPAAGADELQHLVDTIVLIIKTHPTR
jgi:CubicO group peptidase (beta-lactamase class C family)